MCVVRAGVLDGTRERAPECEKYTVKNPKIFVAWPDGRFSVHIATCQLAESKLLTLTQTCLTVRNLPISIT